MRLRVFILIAFLLAMAWLGPAEAEPDQSGEDLIGVWDVALYFSADAPPSATVMEIESAAPDGTLSGSFYQTAFETGRYTERDGTLIIAFMTADGSGSYATSGRLTSEGTIEGQTLSAGRGFLMAWTAAKRD